MNQYNCLGLEDALKLTVDFSAYSMKGNVPDDLPIPVPSDTFCAFVTRPWAVLNTGERDAFQAFYVRVGDKLEDLAEAVRSGAGLDAASWRQVVARLRRSEA